MRIASKIQEIEPFRVVEVLTKAKALEAAGRQIIHMEAGEPDFSTARPIVDAAKASLDRGETYYTQAAGIPELRKAISEFYLSEYGLSISPERIMVTPGASGALLLISALLMNPGDGMLMTDPGYPCNRHFLRLVEGEGQLVPVTEASRFQLTAEIAEQNWRSNTIGAMVASPANPTGEVLTKEQLSALAELCEQKGGSLIVDEIYHGLNYGERASSILEVTDNAFVINSFSKYFGMTGWRLGWLVAPEEAVPHLEKLAQNLFISMSTMGQYAALAAFEPETRRILDGRRDEFAKRRDFLVPELQAMGFGIANKPSGALYVYANIGKFADCSDSFCGTMLEEHGIALTPGADFGRFQADKYVRFAYTTTMPQLELAVERLRAILK